MWLVGTVPFVLIGRILFRLHARSALLAAVNYDGDGLLLFDHGVLQDERFVIVGERRVTIWRV